MFGIGCRLYACSASVVALLAAGSAAHAADAAKPDDASVAEVVVTGSRIAATGFSQPTPTTTISAVDIEKVAEPNLFQTIAQLPALQGSTGRTTFVNSTSSGMQGLSSFSLRGLGPIRTLTLLDGQRVTPANVTGVTDVSQFPQLLVKRVDVVTGGASASYGSDAVGGVVNFITDTRFEGLKLNLEGAESKYKDDKTIVAQAAWGRAFLGDTLHVELSGEYSHEGGIPSGGFGVGHGANGRTWFQSPAFQVRGLSATTDGGPQYFVISQAQQYQYAKYGLITSGPLQGIAFGPNGAPHQFVYGSNGKPTGTGGVTNCFNPFCVGGDLSGVVGQSPSLAGKLEREVAYGRVGYDLTPNDEIFATVNLARIRGVNQPNAGAEKNANLTIQCANPFVPASIQAACAANGITSFQYGTSNGGFPNPVTVHALREQARFVIGAAGNHELFGTSWKYDAYYAYGVNHTHIDVTDISVTPRYNAAIDAIAGPNGTVICRDPAARAAGCVPMNIIGQVPIDPAALAYVLPAHGPKQRSRQMEDVLSVNVSGEPFALWAGPVAVATGFEYREEDYRTVADPYGNGVTAESPYSADYPQDPVVRDSGNNWYAGNYHNGHGYYHVAEGYLEVNVPFLKSETLGEANVNAAVRETKYSTSGYVTAWKIGGVWKTPIDGVRLRAVTSRDIRAPNLSELFAAPVVTNSTVIYNGNTITILRQVLGNPDLKPEIARNTEVGLVLAEPKWLPGFSASFDYYDIRINNAISSLAAQDLVNLCAAGNQQICSAMLLTSPIPNTNYVKVQAFNVASIKDRGFDIEAAYHTSLEGVGLPGELTLHALATRTLSFLTDTGVIGTIPVQSAGVNLGNTPYWKAQFSQGWQTDKVSLTVYERWISDGHYSREFIECQTSCPVSTNNHHTIDNNEMKGVTYVDVAGTYKISDKATAYFKVDNLFNKAPAPAPQTDVGYGANPYLYDVIGRMYRVGVRMNF